jgi:transcriptional regulator with XRE-family HTH domain
MRLRIPELLTAHGVTPYALAKRSGGRVSLSTVYRLVERRGHLQTYSSDLLDTLCDVLGVDPGELFERDVPKRVAKSRS